MSNWPPDPDKITDNQDQQPNQRPPDNRDPAISPLPANTAGREWHLLEKTLLASIEEQRRARRWGIFFKLLTFGYIILVLVLFSRGCSSNESNITGIDMTKPHIAVIDVDGVISADDNANAHDINSALREAYETNSAKAVVLHINSPGGSPVQSDEIWQTMMSLRKEHPDKKLYAVIGDIGASGAYYIASAADEIYVNPSSLVGSIGVIMPSYNVQGLMDKVGVTDRTLTAGEYKDILSLTRPLTEFEQQHVENVLNNTHKHFINAVKQGRGDKLKDPKANNLFSGLFWTGEQSIELGLADKAGNIHTLEEALDIDNVVNYTPIDPMQQLIESFAVKMGAGIGSSVEMKLLPEEEAIGEMR